MLVVPLLVPLARPLLSVVDVVVGCRHDVDAMATSKHTQHVDKFP